MCLPFALPRLSIEELEAAESSNDFCTKLNAEGSSNGQLIEFKAENHRCNDSIYGHALVADGVIKDLYIERNGCSLSKACIVAFSHHIINQPAYLIVPIADKDWLAAAGTSHPMRNECVLFGIRAIQNALSTLKI